MKIGAMAGSAGGFAMGGLQAAQLYGAYRSDRAQGDNPLLAAGKAGVSAFLYNKFMWPTMALQMMPAVAAINDANHKNIGNVQRTMMPMGKGFQDTPYAQTSRARALEAIQASRMNARQYIGAEAQQYATRYR